MAHRKVLLNHGLWDVWDVRPETRAGLAGDLMGGWLCFKSGSARRRLHPIPDRWDELDDEQLAALFAQAYEVRPIHSGPTDLGGAGESVAEPSAAD